MSLADSIRIPPAVLPVFQGEARWRALWGGRGSGKSRSTASMLALRTALLASQGVSGLILCCRQYQNSIADSSFAELVAALDDAPRLRAHFKVGANFLRTIDGRLEFVFRGLDRNLSSLKSLARIRIAWVEEAEYASEEAWRILVPTVREPGSEIWATWNPGSEQSPVNLRLRKNPPAGAKIAECNWRDNPYFPDVLAQAMIEDWAHRPEDAYHIWEGGFKTAWEGAYWGAEMRAAGLAGRVGDYPIIPGIPVHAVADLGARVNNPFWLFQVEGHKQGMPPRLRVVGFYEPEAAELETWRDGLVVRGWNGNLYLPHDIMTHEWAAGRTRFEKVAQMGMRPKRVPLVPIEDGIEAGRTSIGEAVFNATPETQRGLEGFRSYRRRWNTALQQFEAEPVKDWSEHIGSAGRYMFLSWRDAPRTLEKPVNKADPMSGPDVFDMKKYLEEKARRRAEGIDRDDKLA